MNEPVIKTLPIADIKPYGKNPRWNDEAVKKVKQSIERYGYNQLIAVDQQNVIIAGHTRYRALKELGWQQVPVLVLDITEQQARAYRLVDNKTAEYAKWTPDLATELRELGDVLPDIQSFFQDDLGKLLAGSVGSDSTADAVSAATVSTTKQRLDNRFQDKQAKPPMELTCEHCGEKFYVTK